MENQTSSDDGETGNLFDDLPMDGANGGFTPVSAFRKSSSGRKKLPNTYHEDLADASIGQMLSDLSEKIFVTKELSELNTIATILQRLLVSSQQVLTLRNQLRENVKSTDVARDGLDMPTVRRLEKQLKLL
jgi:hypothetical protein